MKKKVFLAIMFMFIGGLSMYIIISQFIVNAGASKKGSYSNGDVNGSGKIDLADPIYLLN